MAMSRHVSPAKPGLSSTSTYGSLTPVRTPTSPRTPLELPKSAAKKAKMCLELQTKLASHPNRWSHTPYPQLNPDIDLSYLLNLVNQSKRRNPLVPLGVPVVPPSTPMAGIDSLPRIYGGKSQPLSPVYRSVLPGFVVPPQEDSPWKHGQVGEILHRTMEQQAKQSAVASASRPRPIKLLDTPPPPVSAFGSGLLYRQSPNKSSIEPAMLSKPSAWGCLLGDETQAALERPTSGFKTSVEKWTKARTERMGQIDGMPKGERIGHPVLQHSVLSPRSPPHFRAVVESGPMDALSTRWDRAQGWLAAHREAESDEVFRTTRPLRVVDKSRRSCDMVIRQGERPPTIEDSIVSYLPAPTTSSLPMPKSSWLARLLGGIKN
ncbi:cyclin [Ceratobasidium sp. AG-Ba]|nr:cyclin [Ceratobasidium sp. AG-Ba]